jgi:uncharacterized membrane protein YccC
VRAAIVPDWLAEVVRPKKAPVPWAAMIRAALAICVPLSVALAVGKPSLGVLPATGGILGTVVDTGGPYPTRVKRVGSAAVFGGAPGLTIGSAIHGTGWIAVVAVVVVAGASGVLSMVGDIGSVTGLQLLVYTSLGLGPVGAQRPVWHTAAGFLVGVLWALILIVPGWVMSPFGKEQRDVAAVYQALAAGLRAVGTDAFTRQRQAVTDALNTAYDELLSARSTAIGRNRRAMRLVEALNASNSLCEAGAALGMAGTRPPPLIISTIERLGDSIRNGTPPPVIPPAWDDSPGMRAMHDAMVAVARVLSPVGQGGRGGSGRKVSPQDQGGPGGDRSPRADTARLLEEFDAGRLGRIFTLRLMICMGVATVVSEVLPLQRSYWVPLTVAIVLKPDFGSVFARALQRAIGTVVGAVAGAVLLVLFHGAWLLIPLAALAALLPFGRSRNYGLLSTFLTPLVVLLVDLLTPVGWRLAEDRLTDTLIGCAIALLIGFAPWPMAWYAFLPRRFAEAAGDVAAYLTVALQASDANGTEQARRLRRSTYQALADLRAEFQRTMSEPPSISRRAAAWWPAVVALEQVMDVVTSAAVTLRREAEPPPSPSAVRELADALRAVSEAAATGTPLENKPGLPDDETLKPVTEVVRALLGVLGGGGRLTAPG